MNRAKRVIVLAWVGVLAGCGGGTGSFSGPSIPVVFDGTSSYHTELLTNDLKVLGGMPPGEGDTSALEVSQFAGAGFNDWLSVRMKFILGKDFDYIANLPEPSGSELLARGVTLAEFIKTQDLSDAYAVNLGSLIHKIGVRIAKVTYTIKIGGQTAEAKTARVGITGISDALFGTSRMISGSPLNSTPNSIIRLATILHEARHTDGKGDDIYFSHTSCNNGQKEDICDARKNGPNGVAGAFLEYALAVCPDCSDEEKEGIRGVIADVKLRIRSDATISTDITPEGAQ